MSKHLFGMILTHQGTYANNRGENEGNATTLQKVLRNGDLYTTVSAESIRYALRDTWQAMLPDAELNRVSVDHRSVHIRHPDFDEWSRFIDDDVLGFMHARQETRSRRGLLEITRAISTTPWRGETMHNFAGPGSNPAVQGNDPIPYAVEVHDTRYQYGFAFTPEALGQSRDDDGKVVDHLTPVEKCQRLAWTLLGLINIRRVGGNHARYLADYSPEAIVLRWTDDPAPRFLYCFEQDEAGTLSVEPLRKRVDGGDIAARELVIGSPLALSGVPAGNGEEDAPTVVSGVKRAVEVVLNRICDDLGWCRQEAGT